MMCIRKIHRIVHSLALRKSFAEKMPSPIIYKRYGNLYLFALKALQPKIKSPRFRRSGPKKDATFAESPFKSVPPELSLSGNRPKKG